VLLAVHCPDKMRSGIPLDDEDRWRRGLQQLADILRQHVLR